MEAPPRKLIAAELDAMYEIVKLLLTQKVVKTFGFTEVEDYDGGRYSIADMEYNSNKYFKVLIEEDQEESGIFIRSALVPDLEIILPLPQMIRMSNKEAEVFDDMC